MTYTNHSKRGAYQKQSPTPKQGKALSPAKFKSDPGLSSFRWEIDLTQDGVNRVALIDGYSKGQGFELANKAELLIRKLTNPLSLYLAKSDEIRVYENTRELPTGQLVRLPKDEQTLILTLHRHDYKAHSWVALCEPITAHLHELYRIFTATGQPPQTRSTQSRKKVWFPELDHSKYTFQSIAELQAFCRGMVPQHGKACMLKWWTAYLAMQPELNQPEAAGPAIVSTLPTGPEQQATQQAMQGLYTKFGQAPR